MFPEGYHFTQKKGSPKGRPNTLVKSSRQKLKDLNVRVLNTSQINILSLAKS